MFDSSSESFDETMVQQPWTGITPSEVEMWTDVR